MPKQKLVEYNRSSILDASRKLFLKYGVEKTSMDDIAFNAECSKATVYVYFKNKEDIYYHITAEYMTSLRDGVRDCFANSADYERAYFTMCNMLARFEHDYPMYFDCILGKIDVSPQKMEELPILKKIFDVGEEINSIVCDFIERAKTDGFAKRDVDPIPATFVMWSSICGLISLCSAKKEYLEDSLGFAKGSFLHNGFSMILDMVRAR